ncbi:hotdog fold thioesterase [Chitinophaga lutea]
MKAIWFSLDISLDQLNEHGQHTMGSHLGMEFTEIGPDYLRAMMPVDARTVQPYRLLHGGASAALAETVGSMASGLIIDPEKQICVGLEINANHIRGVREGYVHAVAKPLHIGSSTHVWDIRITDDEERLVCVSRLTVAILPKR